jgi:iron complex outermembrane receptor protein
VLSASGAINRSIIEVYPNFRCNGDACATEGGVVGGVTDIAGARLPNAPEFSANLAATYTDKLTPTVSWYGRTDYIYKSSEYTDLSNLTKIGANNRVNFRVGLFEDKASVELFVLNAFNNKQYTSVNGTTDIDAQPNALGAYPYAAIVGPPLLRQFGVRARYHF